MTHSYLKGCVCFKVLRGVPDIFPLLLSNLIPLSSEDTVYMSPVLLSVLRFVLWPRRWLLLFHSPVPTQVVSAYSVSLGERGSKSSKPGLALLS